MFCNYFRRTNIHHAYRSKNFNPKILFERISNRNTTNDHVQYLKAFVKAEHEIYGHTYPPYIFSTDCDGALENACLLTWPAQPDKPINKITYANCVLIVLIDIVGNDNTLDVCQANFTVLQKIQPTLLFNCKTHVIRDSRGWSVSVHRGEEHRLYQNQFSRCLMHVICFGCQHWDVIELIIQMGLLLYIVSEDSIHCEQFTCESEVVDKSCRKRCVI